MAMICQMQHLCCLIHYSVHAQLLPSKHSAPTCSQSTTWLYYYKQKHAWGSATGFYSVRPVPVEYNLLLMHHSRRTRKKRHSYKLLRKACIIMKVTWTVHTCWQQLPMFICADNNSSAEVCSCAVGTCQLHCRHHVCL